MNRINFFSRKYFFFEIILCVSVLFFTNCSSNKPKTVSDSVFFEITDSYNRKVTLDKEPQRIISLSPGITEIIYALQSESKLVGRCEFCSYPDSVCRIPSVGGINNVSIEKMVSLNPDLVLISSIVPKIIVEMLEQIHIPVISLKAEEKFSNIFTVTETMGKILNKKGEALQIIAEQQKELEGVRSLFDSTSSNPPTVYYVVGYGQTGDYTAGGNTFINDIIHLAGGKNIAEANTTWSYSRELLFRNQPKHIFIRSEDFENFCKTFPYNTLTAVKKKHVYPIESALLDVQGPRNIEAIKYIATRIHKGH